MTGIIDLLTGFEADYLAIGATAAGVNTRVVPITGWAWWVLVSVNVTYNNLGGAAVVSPVLLTHISANLIIYSTTPGGQVGIGVANNVEWGLFTGQSASVGTGITGSIPFVPIIGEGDVNYGFTGGDAATTMNPAMVCIIGRRHRNKQ